MPDARLRELADAHGISVGYTDWQGTYIEVEESTLIQLLSAIGVEACSADAVEAALKESQLAPWNDFLPPIVSVVQGTDAEFQVHVDHGSAVRVWIEFEDGEQQPLAQGENWQQPREVAGRLVGEATFVVPARAPLGWHTIHAENTLIDGSVIRETTHCIVAPAVLSHQLRHSRKGAKKAWGYAVQLYSLRSHQSWGMGDLGDLREIVDIAGRHHGADFVQVNPLHAPELVTPIEPSPYLPTSRRFLNPLYIRVEDIREVGYAPPFMGSLLEQLSTPLKALNRTTKNIDLNQVWLAKKEALEALFAVPMSVSRREDFNDFCERNGQDLVDYATWCVIADEKQTLTDQWPKDLRNPRSEAVSAFREENSDRVRFYQWLQWLADKQIARSHRYAKDIGMSIGLFADLAVGVHPQGADAWLYADVMAHNVNVGAPPDEYNRKGQNWSQPPWIPRSLAKRSYLPFRDVVRRVFRDVGAVRIDHIMGLFRLWWIPEGNTPDKGAYVYGDHEVMTSIVLLEAHRAGALVVGEDLGVVEPWVRDYLKSRGVLGTSLLWFETQENGEPIQPEEYREQVLVSVATHDFIPAAGYVAGEHLALQDHLGLLGESLDQAVARHRQVIETLRSTLEERGFLTDGAEEQTVVEALYRFLAHTPSELLAVGLADAVGERKPQNMPGVSGDYPNWQIPLSDSDGQAILIEDLLPRASFAGAHAASLARAINQELERGE